MGFIYSHPGPGQYPLGPIASPFFNRGTVYSPPPVNFAYASTMPHVMVQPSYPSYPAHYGLSPRPQIPSPPPATVAMPLPQVEAQPPVVPPTNTLPQAAHNHTDKRGLNTLQTIKVFYSGLSGGAIATLLFGVPFKYAFGVEFVKSIAECILARKVYAAKSPWTANILNFSNRVVGGPNKRPCDLSSAEKNRCLAPISAIGSVLGCLSVATVNYLIVTRKVFKAAPIVPYKQLLNNYKKAASLNKALPALRLVGHYVENFKPVKWLHDNPKLLFPMAIASGLFWGLMEGLAAQKVIQKKIQASSTAS